MDIDCPPLTFDRIKGKYWRFSHENGFIASEIVKFLPDGTIGGYHHDNERFWQIEHGLLSLLDTNREISITFDEASFEGERILLKGKHRGVWPTLYLQEHDARPQDSETKLALAEDIEQLGWSIGDHTYGVPELIEKGMSKLVIGKYCSIAGGVKIVFGNHRVDTFTTFPFKIKGRFWEHVPDEAEDHNSKGDVIIGSDVWLGVDAFIGSGVTIGSGAVIGAKAVITKNIPAYAIVVGNPGRIIRYRFAPPIIEELLELAWWDLPDEAVDALLPQLMSTDAAQCLQAIRRARAAMAPAA